MNYTLENEQLRVTIESLGAEVISVVDKATETELWWKGDPAFWAGHSPILFPACGGLWDGFYHLNAQRYPMPKHGFVRKAEWTQTDEVKGQRITFQVEDDRESRIIYPFQYRLQVTYLLQGRSLQCLAQVDNRMEADVMYYQLGGHPALALPDYQDGAQVIGYLRPICQEGSSVENLSVVRAGEQGCLGHERYALPLQQGLIPICTDTFSHEALILDEQQTQRMELLRADGCTPIAEVSYEAPVCLIWQQQNQLCPFICIEPWYGAPDYKGQSVDLAERPYTQQLKPLATQQHDLWQIAFA